MSIRRLDSRVRRHRLLAIQSATQALVDQESLPADSIVARTEPSRSEPSFQQVRGFLKGTAPRTWLFVGDSLGFAPQFVRRSYIEYFSDALRTRLHRTTDAIVDITVDESSVLALRDNSAARLKRFQPDVVFLMPGVQDVATGPDGRAAFERALREIADRTQEHGSVLVMATPPLLLAATQAEFSDLPAYVDIIRQVAQDRGLLVVDHWKYWQLASETRDIDEWVDASCTRLLHEGHRRASQLLLRTLGVLVTARRTPR